MVRGEEGRSNFILRMNDTFLVWGFDGDGGSTLVPKETNQDCSSGKSLKCKYRVAGCYRRNGKFLG